MAKQSIAAAREHVPVSQSWIDAATWLFGFMVSIPFLDPHHRLPLTSFESEWLAMLFGVAGTFCAALAWRNGPLQIPCVAAAPLALMMVVAAQAALGMFSYSVNAFTVSMYLLWSVMLSIAGALLAQGGGKERVITRLAWFMVIAGLVNAIFGILQFLQWSQAFSGLIAEPMEVSLHGVYGNLAQQNHFSTHIALAIASACYLFATRRLPMRWFAQAGLVLLVALALSGSRSGFLHLALIGVLLMPVLRRRGGDMERRHIDRFTLALCGLLACAVLALAVWGKLPLIARLSAISNAFGPRIYLWKHAIAMFADHPLLGVGFDGFAFELVGQLHKLGMPTAWGIDQYAHNFGLQLLAVAGVCGFLAVAIPLVPFVRRQWKVRYTPERMWLWSALGLLFIHSMLEQPLYYAYFLGIAALAAGMADTASWRVQGDTAVKTVAVALGCAALLLAKTANDYAALERVFYGDQSPSNADMRRQTARTLHDFSIFAPHVELASPADFVPVNAPVAAKIEFNSRVMRFAPVAEVEFRHAALLAEAGRITEAMAQFDRAALSYPDEAAQYLERFAALAAADATTYGTLATHAVEFVTRRNSAK